MSPTGDLFEDVVRFGGPDEGFWIDIVVVQVILNSGFQFGDTFEDAASNSVSGDQTEEVKWTHL